MATDFWRSSHYKYWLVDQATLEQARVVDLLYAKPREIALMNILFANVIARLGKRLDLRQQVIATAIVFFRRFYLRSSYCETDPFFVAAACCYVAAKVEESPTHLKSVVAEARTLFGAEYGIKTFPSDHTKLGEMEFYLLEDLDFHLTVFHPYRDLADLCGSNETVEMGEEGEVGYVPEDERFWGTGKGKLALEEGAVQTAWFIISDSLRTELCLLYPPYIIAIAALYMTCVLHGSISSKLYPPTSGSGGSGSAAPIPGPSRFQSPALSKDQDDRTQTSTTNISPRDEIINFLAGLNVSLELIGSVCQQILGMYALWDTFTDQTEQDISRRAERRESQLQFYNVRGITPPQEMALITEKDVVAIVLRIRAERETDLASGWPVAVIKRAERGLD